MFEKTKTSLPSSLNGSALHSNGNSKSLKWHNRRQDRAETFHICFSRSRTRTNLRRRSGCCNRRENHQTLQTSECSNNIRPGYLLTSSLSSYWCRYYLLVCVQEARDRVRSPTARPSPGRGSSRAGSTSAWPRPWTPWRRTQVSHYIFRCEASLLVGMSVRPGCKSFKIF